ncbi:hypothetical protein T11_3344 [Trichinella zimbabwensis]|uniref:Uncharacterized protein n=1 Tax=Trichinella zimbabwensis TaxID=268475 RepID=A0A0V1GX03_9BILA|nr:hypothetical protein T11_3344 [Trichinella zimbabwensis]
MNIRNYILLNTRVKPRLAGIVHFRLYFHGSILMVIELTLLLELRAVVSLVSLSICLGVTTLKLERTALAYVYRWYIQPYIVQLSLAFQHNRVMYNAPDICGCFAHAALISRKSPLYYHIKRQRP